MGKCGVLRISGKIAAESASRTRDMSVNGGSHHQRFSATRRRFVLGIAALGASTAYWRATARGETATASGPDILTGDRFDLTIGSIPANITGRARNATVINGTMPGPSLHLREGDTVTIN